LPVADWQGCENDPQQVSETQIRIER